MKTTLFLHMLWAFLLSGTAATATYAQTEALVITSTTLDSKGKSTSSKAYLKDDKMVVETGSKKQQTVLFDAGKETFFVINSEKKEYTEITREDLEALSSMMQQQMANLNQQLKLLPESQRAMIKEKMGAAFGGEQKDAEYTLEEKGVQVKEWKANKYVGTADGKKQSEIYIASFNELGQNPEDFKAMGSLFDLMKEYMQGMTKNMASMNLGFFGQGMPDYKEGIPVKSITYNAQQEPVSTSTIESISEEEVDKKLFTIPENFKKQKMAIN